MMIGENGDEGSRIAFDFDDERQGYDPLADEGMPDDEDEGEYQDGMPGYIGDPGELAAHSQIAPEPPKTPQEKIAELFSNMAPFKRIFLAVMDYCLEPKGTDELDSFVADLQRQRKSVYSAASFCQMLAGVEALEKVTEDGAPYVEVVAEPEEIEDEQGNVYLKPQEPPRAFWRTTEEGRQVVEEDKPVDALLGIIADHARYEPVFADILRLCDVAGGLSINEIKAQVNSNPILASPPKTAQFFMDYLERNGALVWNGGWKTTDIGKELLALLDA